MPLDQLASPAAVPSDGPSRQPLDIQDYLDASSDASKRTRSIVIAILVASVLIFAALLNSVQTQWLHLRMKALADINSPYVATKLGVLPSSGSPERKLYEERYRSLCEAIERAYVDASFVIRVPFFGISFDVNDLGLFGSVGFLLMLTCYRFFLSRELDNLQISFDAARSLGNSELRTFYQLLSMRQVFTIPQTQFTQNRLLPRLFRLVVSKSITWMPLALLLAVMWNDYTTSYLLKYLGPDAVARFNQNLFFAIPAVVGIAYLSTIITIRLVEMDRIWHACWVEINTGGANK